MIINITDKLTYDTDKAFAEQEYDTQEYLSEVMTHDADRTEYDAFERPHVQYWNVNGNSLLCTWIYFRDEPDWVLKEQIITMEEGYEC